MTYSGDCRTPLDNDWSRINESHQDRVLLRLQRLDNIHVDQCEDWWGWRVSTETVDSQAGLAAQNANE